jgi:phosphohistidine phosphatase
MKTLYLLRHAHTVAAAPPLMGDYERILSPQGSEEAMAIGRYMLKNGIFPDFVLSSSAVRTLQTARLIFSVLFNTANIKVASSFERSLYQASAAKILSEIHDIAPTVEKLLVVAHNPGVAQLAEFLGSREFGNYQPATLSVFTCDCSSWEDLSPDTAEFKEILEAGRLAA